MGLAKEEGCGCDGKEFRRNPAGQFGTSIDTVGKGKAISASQGGVIATITICIYIEGGECATK